MVISSEKTCLEKSYKRTPACVRTDSTDHVALFAFLCRKHANLGTLEKSARKNKHAIADTADYPYPYVRAPCCGTDFLCAALTLTVKVVHSWLIIHV